MLKSGLHWASWNRPAADITVVTAQCSVWERKSGKHIAIAYASRKLQQFGKNYSPLLLEMQATVWAMDHFQTCGKTQHYPP